MTQHCDVHHRDTYSFPPAPQRGRGDLSVSEKQVYGAGTPRRESRQLLSRGSFRMKTLPAPEPSFKCSRGLRSKTVTEAAPCRQTEPNVRSERSALHGLPAARAFRGGSSRPWSQLPARDLQTNAPPRRRSWKPHAFVTPRPVTAADSETGSDGQLTAFSFRVKGARPARCISRQFNGN